MQPAFLNVRGESLKTMDTYILTLLVNAEQEHAIRTAFIQRGWFYTKTGSRPAYKEEMELFYKTSAVDGHPDPQLKSHHGYIPMNFHDQQHVYGPYQNLLQAPLGPIHMPMSDTSQPEEDMPVNFSFDGANAHVSSNTSTMNLTTSDSMPSDSIEQASSNIIDSNGNPSKDSSSTLSQHSTSHSHSANEQDVNTHAPNLQMLSSIVTQAEPHTDPVANTTMAECNISNTDEGKQNNINIENLQNHTSTLTGCNEKDTSALNPCIGHEESHTGVEALATCAQESCDMNDGALLSADKQQLTESIMKKLLQIIQQSGELTGDYADSINPQFVNMLVHAFEKFYTKKNTNAVASTARNSQADLPENKAEEIEDTFEDDSKSNLGLEQDNLDSNTNEVLKLGRAERHQVKKYKRPQNKKVKQNKAIQQKRAKLISQGVKNRKQGHKKPVAKKSKAIKTIAEPDMSICMKGETSEESCEVKVEMDEVSDTEIYDIDKTLQIAATTHITQNNRPKRKSKTASISKKFKDKLKKEMQDDSSGIWTKESRFGINRNLRLHSFHKKCKTVPTDLDSNFFSASENGYYCPDCNFVFHKLNKLQLHKKLKAGEVCVPDCIFCDAEENKNVFQCLKCPKVFESKELLERHIAKHVSEVFNCNFCSFGFYTIHDLKFHMQQNHSDEIKQTFLCDLCGSKFKEKKILNAHRKYVHTDERPESCPTCQRKFKTKSQLKNHLVTHKTAADLDLSCEVCGKMFTRVATLKDHVRRHKKDFTFFCDVCKKGFYRKHGLEEHMRVHTGDKPFDCKFCGFKSALSCNLVKHMKIHQKQGIM